MFYLLPTTDTDIIHNLHLIDFLHTDVNNIYMILESYLNCAIYLLVAVIPLYLLMSSSPVLNYLYNLF